MATTERSPNGIQEITAPDGETRYRVRMWVNKKRVSKTFHSAKEARIWLGRLEDHKRSVHLGVKSVQPDTFSNVVGLWVERCLNVYFAPSMKILNKQLFEKQFLPHFADKMIDEIGPNDWQEYLGYLRLEHGWANATFNRRRSLLLSFYNWCIDENLVVENPITKIRKLKESEKETRFLTQQELPLFLDAISEEPLELSFMILLNTGMRVGECLGLTWKDIDFDRGFVRIAKIYCKQTKKIENRTKTGKSRIIGLSDNLGSLLAEERTRRFLTAADDLVITRENGESPGHERMRDAFEQGLKRAGLEIRGIHELRHTFASHFMMNGGSLWDLKTILGHSTIDLTERYSHFAPNHLKEKAEKVVIRKAEVRQPAMVVNFSDMRRLRDE